MQNNVNIDKEALLSIISNNLDNYMAGTEAVGRSKSNAAIRKANEIINDVNVSTKEIQANTLKMTAALLDGLDPSKSKISTQNGSFNEIDNSRSLLTLEGKTKNNNNIMDIIKEKVNRTNRELMLNAPGGIYKHIVMCRRNVFMNNRFPLLKKSNRLFVDDMNNGSFRGSKSRPIPFKVFDSNGSQIKDLMELKKINEILNPSSQSSLSQDKVSFNDIQTETDCLFRQDGIAMILVKANKDICKEVYIKYILSQKKKRDIQEIKAKIATESVLKVLDPKEFYKVGCESELEYNSTLDEQLFKQYESKVPSSAYGYVDEYYLQTPDGNKTRISTLDKFEIELGLESFEEFATRYLQGGCNEIMSCPTALSKNGMYFSVGIGQIPSEYAAPILNEMFNRSMNSKISVGIESCNTKTDKLSNYLTEDERNTLLNSSFSDIYNIHIPDSGLDGPSDIPNYIGTESLLLTEGRDNLESIYLKTLRMESIDDSILEGTECVTNLTELKDLMTANNNIIAGLESKLAEFTSDMTPGLETGAAPGMSTYGFPTSADPYYNTHGQTGKHKVITKQLEKEISEKSALFNKLEKTFGSVLGETTITLDGTRCVPVFGGNRFLGVFNTEYTHQDVSYLVTMRTVLGNPVSFSSNMDMLDLNREEYEEIIGRLIFSDTIKPIIEKNMSTKFIKDNSEIIHTLQQLLEENEISNQMAYSDLTRFSMYNLAKVTFIPASEIILKRNGISGMGESLYENVTIPAMAYIIINECILSYYLVDAKGISFLVVPKGMNPDSNTYGQSTIEDVIRSINVTRSDMNDLGAYNFGLTHKIVTLYKDPDLAQSDIQVQSLQYPDFNIDQAFISTLEQMATGGVGYNSALYTSKDGSSVELAKKLYEMNDTEALEILKYQQFKQKPDSQLATRMLRLRGGEKYKNYVVVWEAPDINRGNRSKGTEALKEIKESLDTQVDIISTIYKGNKDVNSSMEAIKLRIIANMKIPDLSVQDIEQIVQDGIRDTKTAKSTEVQEQVNDTTNLNNEYEEENEDLFGSEEL